MLLCTAERYSLSRTASRQSATPTLLWCWSREGSSSAEATTILSPKRVNIISFIQAHSSLNNVNKDINKKKPSPREKASFCRNKKREDNILPYRQDSFIIHHSSFIIHHLLKPVGAIHNVCEANLRLAKQSPVNKATNVAQIGRGWRLRQPVQNVMTPL